MKNQTHTRLKLLNIAINRWREQPKMDYQNIAMAVVEKIQELGMEEVLAEGDIDFSSTGDVLKDVPKNSQKLRRWLGQSKDVREQCGNLWQVEPAIVAAMPTQIRFDYLNAVYFGTGVTISGEVSAEASELLDALSSFGKEHSEAFSASLTLLKSGEPENVLRAVTELTESKHATETLIATVQQKQLRVV